MSIEEGFDVRKTTKFGVQDVYIIGLNLLIPLNLLSETSTLREILIGEKGINRFNGIKTDNQRTEENQTLPKCETRFINSIIVNLTLWHQRYIWMF